MKVMVALTVSFFFAMVPVVSADEAPADASSAAKVYLEAARKSDLRNLDGVATASMLEWTRRYLPVVFGYEILRGERKCSEPVNFGAVGRAAADYLDVVGRYKQLIWAIIDGRGRETTSAELKAFGEQMKVALAGVSESSPCLAIVLNTANSSGLMQPESLRTVTGIGSIELLEILVDIRKPGRGGSIATERSALMLARLRAAASDSGWKAIGLGAFSR